ncbi:MAG: hypothetical protein J6T90_01010 [Methanomicrobium sp.]|nr:hypothetical protein [Methanomicrobium sp.]
MKFTASQMPGILSLILLLLSLCTFTVSALELSEEKTIFAADDTEYLDYVIDSGNIFIFEFDINKYIDKNDRWSRLYFYNISTDKLTELTFEDMSNAKGQHPIAISGNTVYWIVNPDLRSYDPDVRSYDTVSKSLRKLSVPQSYPDGLAVEGKTIVYTGRNFPDGNDDPDICISTDAGANFKRYRLPVHQVNAKINGNIVVFDDSRYGLMRESVHYLDIDTGEFHQIGDETKGIYYYPDISGSNVVYIFDPDFDSYLKDQYNVNQEVHLTDISTNKTSIIASPNAQITSLAIDKDYIVWCDNRNKSNYKLYLYNLKENKEYSVADIIDKNGADTHISKNTIVWADDLDNKRVVKIVTIRDDETITDNGGNSGNDDTDNTGNSDSTQPQNADSQTASGEVVWIIVSVGIALIAVAGYHGRKNN